MEAEIKVIVSPGRTVVRMAIEGKDVDWDKEDNRKAANAIMFSAMQFLYLCECEKKTKEKIND